MGQTIALLPDYFNDLNAMHEAEKVLTESQQMPYRTALFCTEEVDYSYFKLIHATAAQRAEAFLRTIGKWEDSE